MADNSERKPRSNRHDQQRARLLQKELGIKYTKALRFVKNEGKPPTAEGMQIIGLMIEKGFEKGLKEELLDVYAKTQASEDEG